MSSAKPSIFWFRRDLRLSDNPALAAAAAEGPVLPVFVLDRALRGPAGANRLAFLHNALEVLRHATGGNLAIVDGKPAEVLPTLAAEIGAERVYAAADFGPYGQQRDEDVAASLGNGVLKTGSNNFSNRASLLLVDSPYAVPPGSVVTGSGTSYKVFTPFFRTWKANGWPEPIDAPVVDWLGIDRWELPPMPETAIQLPPAGEAAAADALTRFLDRAVSAYASARDQPATDGTSRLSPYLKWGNIHPRQILSRLGASQGEETFRSEICWREFYAEVLYSRPDSARAAYIPWMGGMEVDSGPDADERFEAWCKGLTGYPIVDAGMRQLTGEGWMHNRVRMIVASFLVKDLHIDWTRGARHFMNLLVDADLASNNHGWQWVAGTGTDASPYFRIFNPVSQAKKFDATGEYVRRWIPEIAHLPDRSIHAPWTEKAGPPAGYPPPIIDHDAERKESLDRYERLKKSRQRQ